MTDALIDRATLVCILTMLSELGGLIKEYIKLGEKW